MPTVRVPPLPKSGSASVRDRDSPGWGRVEEEAAGEEGRVFEWMTGMLRGSGALGTTGIVPGAGSPVVLDLGAVSQASTVCTVLVLLECPCRTYNTGINFREKIASLNVLRPTIAGGVQCSSEQPALGFSLRVLYDSTVAARLAP